MLEKNGYETNAWQGERPSETQLVDDPNHVMDSIPQPSASSITLSKIRVITLFILCFALLFSFVWGVIGNAFANGFHWQEMVADKNTFSGFILFFIILFIAIISFYFEQQYNKRYSLFNGYEIKVSKRINAASCTLLGYADYIPMVPSKILGLINLSPNIWEKKGFYDAQGKSKFHWDEQSLIGYDYIEPPLYYYIKIANAFNWIFISIGWPVLMVQLMTTNVYLPAYIVIYSVSILLLVSRSITKAKGGVKYPVITFHRRSGMVSKQYKGKQEWCCHFSELNAYIYNEHSRYSELFWIILLPRFPVGCPRKDVNLSEWANTTPESCRELWKVIQGFMNTSCPLPFVMPLDAVRDKDPTTQHIKLDAEFNKFKQLSRLSDAQYKKLLEEPFSMAVKLV